MSKSVNLLSIISFSIIFLSGCYEEPICHDEIWLKNNSQERIFFIVNRMEDNDDTLLPFNTKSDSLSEINYRTAGANETRELFWNVDVEHSCYEYTMNDNKKYYSLAIINWETFWDTPWDTIQKYDMVLKRYLIDLDLLQKNNFIIEYP